MALNPFEQLQQVVTEPRQAFEDIVAMMLKSTIPGSRRVRVHKGDGGVDVYEGTYGIEGGVDVYQIKYFPFQWEEPQKRQIKNSYETARNNAEYKLKTWTLCVPARLTKNDIRWFDEWRTGHDIELLDGDDLTNLLNQEECKQARQKLREWGVGGIQPAGALFSGNAVICRSDGVHASVDPAILDTMANRRSVTLAANRSLIPKDFEAALPIPLRADFLKRSSQDSIQSSDEIRHPANRFQVDFWDALTADQWISASAPTSAGKSFLLRLWVAEVYRRKKTALVAFIVPTRALIQEFSDAFGEDVTSGVLKNVTLHALPLEEDFDEETGHLFVFTQERLHILLSRRPDTSFDLLVVDEAQKVGDGCRGVLLEQVIAECMRRSSKTQIVYASPFVENPAYLTRGAPKGHATRSVEREVTTVTQNLVFASQKRGDPSTWTVSYVAGEHELPIGTISLPFRATSPAKRLSTVAFAMQSPDGGNLVYANGPSKAEGFAQHISDGYLSQRVPSLEDNPRISDLIKLVRKTIHPKYLLVETLKHGVAFHYGNMPLLIRTEIEALFRDNILRFLVCTATLIEGVNLPCKVIFMRGPTKGIGNPMQPADFWNLAGRAGRWGTEFHGTIVCIDPKLPDVWKEPPPTKRVRQRIMAATEHTLEEVEALLGYIETGYPGQVGLEHPEFDYTLTFLFHALLRNDSLIDLRPTCTSTADVRAGVLKALSLAPTGMSQKKICDSTGINYQTVALFLKKNSKDFKTTESLKSKRYFLK